MNYRRLWFGFAFVMIASFAVLGYYGREIYRQAPPIPEKVVTSDGQELFTGDNIRMGQRAWQSTGGQELGSVWGHGAYQAPDWTADWLHRESVWLLNHWALAEGATSFDDMTDEQQAPLRARLINVMRTNTYDPETKTLTISPDRAAAMADTASHFDKLFGGDPSPEMVKLRTAYAMKSTTMADAGRRSDMNTFLWWATWAMSAQRPGMEISYTSNWPHEPLVGNVPTGSIIIWSIVSFVFLLAGIAGLAWYYAVQHRKHEPDGGSAPVNDPLLALNPTPSMRATLKYFWVVAALMVVQVGMGVITAHYGVEGNGFYGIPLQEYLPYAVTRTWHTQLGIFWIATAWLATGLFIAPAVSGKEPPFQRALVNILFVCLLVIVVGSLGGQWAGAMQKLDLDTNFWFGHQGLEYVDLGRFWQIFLTVGLFIWLFIMVRAMNITRKAESAEKNLLYMFLLASLAIPLFYTAGLMWGRNTHYSIIEYWRWWVVHLWVEGFFEVFATVVIAFLFTRMQLIRTSTATAAVLFSTIIFLSGGIIGTFHHLYFTGTPISIMALGASFSALEVVPLVLIGFEAYENLTLSRAQPWVAQYKWPIYFFVAVAFWNMVGAGLFGFLINPPIALYYMQGLNTTAVHAHTALFGVYGMLGIGLMLFCLKGLATHHAWRTKWLNISFWAINIGLAMMVILSLLPVGMLQTVASVNHGYWYARSADFLQTDTMQLLRWLRVPGDTIFAGGMFALGYFIAGLKFGWSIDKNAPKLTDGRMPPKA
ncbi:nitric oxide reductase large subunit [candidate division BRC1 bacterium HGW-BRC1-1]|jgi:nitric oxide reductase subunit B|nr:MAG: nitric oxide reductase large subunit [candidate division BRC1 bacterium HGW-BRC1-1]